MLSITDDHCNNVERDVYKLALKRAGSQCAPNFKSPIVTIYY